MALNFARKAVPKPRPSGMSKEQLALLDERAALQTKLSLLQSQSDRKAPGAGERIVEGQIRRLGDRLMAPTAVPTPPRKPAPKPAAQAPAAPTPPVSPVGTVGVPELTQVPPSPALPTVDDAARDVAAAQPLALDPAAEAVSGAKGILKRKKYGVAATELTSPLGITNLGNIGTKALLG